MRNLNQQILKFDYEQNFKDQDFYVSSSNKHAFYLLSNWPKWEKKFINISGEKYSGKSHLINIFMNKFKGIKVDAKNITDQLIKECKVYQNIIIEDLDKNVNEKLIFTLINIIDQDNKYLIITSQIPVVDIKFKLNDLKSRFSNFILSQIEKPEDDLMYALILKNLSDRQISIDKKLIEFIIKRINRSYGKISEFIYKIDEISLKRKKPIDFKIIKEALED